MVIRADLGTEPNLHFDAVDISSSTFWAQDARTRDEAFAVLRHERPVSLQRPPDSSVIPTTAPYWAVVRHADIQHVSRHPELFCSSKGTNLEDVPPEIAEAAAAFLTTDAPRHTQLRGLVQHAFTVRRVQMISEQISECATDIVADAVRAGSFEVVETLAMRLPLWTISEMLGVPPADREGMYEAANSLVGTSDPEIASIAGDPLTAMFNSVMHIHELSARMLEERRQAPTDDLMTALLEAEVDGAKLTEDEIGAFLCLLAVAGNDTTRNTLSHAVKAFADHPDQWTLLRSDPESFLPTAVEESLRWANSVMQFRRTATQDCELNGQHIREGDRVVMVYPSGNRDEAVFNRPWDFDISRKPNNHLAFGGGGPHFCLGASIARTQLRAVIGELARTVSNFEVDEPQMVPGSFIHGIKRMNCSVAVDGGLAK